MSAIPTELVGSLPRPMKLQEAYEAYDQGKIEWADLQAEQDAAAEDSIRRLEAVGLSGGVTLLRVQVDARDGPSASASRSHAGSTPSASARRWP